ncbi:hypothetical protein EVAR_75519_1 [Eumeta japonica]|uniref:Uncharacterized protein n=1 Tax=Eumeta variegata TaxID=151549 RepID=A0A4C1UJW0_EUMVA|nr:hypothetical protein EVAR_75519_1 [Eumeta japonica]
MREGWGLIDTVIRIQRGARPRRDVRVPVLADHDGRRKCTKARLIRSKLQNRSGVGAAVENATLGTRSRPRTPPPGDWRVCGERACEISYLSEHAEIDYCNTQYLYGMTQI